MKSKVVTRTSWVLALLVIMLFACTCVSFAADATPTPAAGGKKDSVGYLNEEDDSGLLKDQENTFKDVARSVVKFLVLILDTAGVIALVVLGITLLFGLGDPTNRQKIKSAMVIIFFALLIGNAAVFLVNWIINIAGNLK